jgi:hypothetical protein
MTRMRRSLAISFTPPSFYPRGNRPQYPRETGWALQPVSKILRNDTTRTTTASFPIFRNSLFTNQQSAYRSRNSNYATQCAIGVRGPARGMRFFSIPKIPNWVWGPPSLIIKGYQRFFAEVKGPGRDVYHPPPQYSAEVTNEWSYTSTPRMSSWRGQGDHRLLPFAH